MHFSWSDRLHGTVCSKNSELLAGQNALHNSIHGMISTNGSGGEGFGRDGEVFQRWTPRPTQDDVWWDDTSQDSWGRSGGAAHDDRIPMGSGRPCVPGRKIYPRDSRESKMPWKILIWLYAWLSFSLKKFEDLQLLGSGGPNYGHLCGLSAPPVHHDAGWHTACVAGDSLSKTYAVSFRQELRWWRSRRQPRQSRQIGGVSASFRGVPNYRLFCQASIRNYYRYITNFNRMLSGFISRL